MEYPDAAALPVLKEILYDNVGKSRGQFMYAVMAIHAMDTPESKTVLEEALSDPFHYGTTDRRIRQVLNRAKQNQVDSASLINRYYLSTLSDDIGVVLNQEAAGVDSDNAVCLTYTLTNTTEHTLGLLDYEPEDAATMIWLRDAEGQIYSPYRLSLRYERSPAYVRLDPGEPLTHDFTLRFVEKGGKYRAASSHAFYSLPGPGEYEAFMLFERREIDAADSFEIEQHGLCLPDGEEWWAGRVVSDPITIKFAGP
jgi:hypothetical protein